MHIAAVDDSHRFAPEDIAVSAIVVVDDQPKLAALLDSYRRGLDALGKPYELICIVDGRSKGILGELTEMTKHWGNLIVIGQRPWSGEDAALMAAFKRARANLILTLSGWPEMEPEDFGNLFDALEDNDMVVGARDDTSLGELQTLRRGVLQRFMRMLFGHSVKDVFCRARLTRREVIDEIGGFGVRQHFLPIMAAERGFRVVEASVRPGTLDGERAKYVFKPLGHLRALFDALALFVVLKFLRRPLRFFGAIGLPIFLIGLVATTVLVGFRLFGEMALADRPALIFSVLMIVLGIQIIALGLVGEIVIFANSRRMKQYTVQDVIRKDPEA